MRASGWRGGCRIALRLLVLAVIAPATELTIQRDARADDAKPTTAATKPIAATAPSPSHPAASAKVAIAEADKVQFNRDIRPFLSDT